MTLFSPDDYAARRAALQRRLSAEGVDAAVLTDEANITYFTGYEVEFFFLSRSRTIALLVPACGEPLAVAPASHARDVTIQTGLHAIGYEGLRCAPVEQIGAALDELEARRIGCELGFEQRVNLTLDDVEALRRRVRGDVVDVTAALWALRTVKSAAEQAVMAQACDIATQAWQRCLPHIRAGQAERDVAARLGSEIALLGGRPAFLIVTSGRGDYYRSNGAPRGRALERGDLLFVDIGVRFCGYYSDFNRTAVVGRPTAEQASFQARVKEVTESAARHLTPGVTAAEVYARVLADCRDAGIALRVPGRIGHGLGLCASEPPHISAEDTTPLVEGLVTTIEPMVERDDGLYCAEVIYAVTPAGGRPLNAAGSPLYVVEEAG